MCRRFSWVRFLWDRRWSTPPGGYFLIFCIQRVQEGPLPLDDSSMLKIILLTAELELECLVALVPWCPDALILLKCNYKLLRDFDLPSYTVRMTSCWCQPYHVSTYGWSMCFPYLCPLGTWKLPVMCPLSSGWMLKSHFTNDILAPILLEEREKGPRT